jgi:hypothetical protein
MNHDKIEINGEAYKVGFSFYAIKQFEELTGKSIEEARGTWDNLMYFYASLKGLNPNFEMSLPDFVKYMDEHPKLLIQFQTQTPAEDGPGEKEQGRTPSKKKSLLRLWMLLPLLLVSPVLLPLISGIAWIGLSLMLAYMFIAKLGKKRGYRSWRSAVNSRSRGTEKSQKPKK